MDPISAVLGIATLVPNILKWITGNNKAADTATQIVNIAKQVTGKDTTDDAMAAIKADPAMALQLQTEIDNNKSILAKIASDETVALRTADSTDMATVNKTIQTEAGTEHWLSYSWRPLVGLTWCFLVVADYFVLPLAHVPVPTIPTEVWLGFSAILGVASFFRGKAQADPAINNTYTVTSRG